MVAFPEIDSVEGRGRKLVGCTFQMLREVQAEMSGMQVDIDLEPEAQIQVSDRALGSEAQWGGHLGQCMQDRGTWRNYSIRS